ncbi:MAG: hypothetical protein ACAI44_14775 [Candidatus Sericytochromatia bacterium]
MSGDEYRLTSEDGDREEINNLLQREDSALLYGVESPILQRIREIQGKMQHALEVAGEVYFEDDEGQASQIQ